MQYLPTEWFVWIIVYSLYLTIPVYFYICITFKYIFVYLKKKTIPGINIYTYKYIVLCIYLSHFANLLSKFVSLVQASLAAASLVAANTSCQRLPGCLRSILQLHMQLLAANKLASCVSFFCLLVVVFFLCYANKPLYERGELYGITLHYIKMVEAGWFSSGQRKGKELNAALKLQLQLPGVKEWRSEGGGFQERRRGQEERPGPDRRVKRSRSWCNKMSPLMGHYTQVSPGH